jgi:hypothetical protein
MKRARFLIVYFALALAPIAIYAARLGLGLDAYGVSVALGLFAYMVFCGQFILASRPQWALEALGQKGLFSFHGTMAFVALVAAVLHRSLKVGLLEAPPTAAAAPAGFLKSLAFAFKNGLGFNPDSLQASLGGIGWWSFAGILLFTVLFMANTFWMKFRPLKSLREWVYKKTGLSYPLARLLHNLTVLAASVILVHALFASSSQFSDNPLGAIWLIGAFVLSLAAYLRYRLLKKRRIP